MNMAANHTSTKRAISYHFMSYFSMLYRKENSEITKFEVENARPAYKVFYCLKSWFENGDLKQEYKQKIFQKYGIA